MTQLRNRDTGQVRTSNEVEREIRQHTSAPAVIDFTQFGYDVVFPSPTPAYDKITQFVRELAPEQINDKWYQVFEVVALDQEQIDANIEAARVAAIPAQVSPRQIRQALTAIALRSAVEAAVAAGSQDLKDWWEFATAIERQHPMVIDMATGLGVTERQLDDLFTLAGTL